MKKFLTLILAIYLGCMGFLFIFQRSFLYFPQACTVEKLDTLPLPFKTTEPINSDGIKLKGFYAERTTQPFTLVFFHGNADCIGNLFDVAEPYVRAGYGFLLAEYRGFSGLEGSPSEEGFYKDALTHLRFLKDQGVEETKIILFGHSLGTGVATQIATEIKEAGLILVAPFLSVGDMAQERYPIFPVKWLTRDRFDNSQKIKNIGSPLLLVHGTTDHVIPYKQGKELFDSGQEPKKFVHLEGFDHSNLFDSFAPYALDWLKNREE